MKQKSVLGKRYDKSGRSHAYIKDERLRARNINFKNSLSETVFKNILCLCGADYDDLVLATVDRWGFKVTTVLCKQCGLIRLNPRWDNATYLNIYKKYYWPLASGNFAITQSRFQLSVERAANFIDWLTTHIEMTGKNVLEIGCSYGATLHCLKNSTSKLTGYDHDPRILEIGRSYTKLDLREGGLSAALQNGEQYDLVILRHVFEHFLDPVSEGSSLKALLSEGGKLIIEVPGVLDGDLLSRSNDFLMLTDAFHPFSYTLDTLKNVLSSCGFTFQFGNEYIYSCWSREIEVNERHYRREHALFMLQSLKRKEIYRRKNII